MTREINLNLLKKEKNRQAWDVTWFESSDEEDNDTEGNNLNKFLHSLNFNYRGK